MAMKLSKGAKKILRILRDFGCQVIPEYEFGDLRGKKGVPLRYDFYAVSPRIGKVFLVEYDGEMHFKQVNSFKNLLLPLKPHKSETGRKTSMPSCAIYHFIVYHIGK